MIRKTISLLALLSVFATAVNARITTTIPAVLSEGTVLNLTGSNFENEATPLAASLKTSDGTIVTLDATVVSPNKIKVTMPMVTYDTKAALRISGGNVKATKPQEYLVLILAEPTSAFITPTNGDDIATVPSTVTTNTHAATATTATSATSATTATSVTGPTQSSITAITAVTTIGAVNNTVSFPGSITVNSGITGNVTGNLTGNVTATTVTATTVVATTFNGTTESAIAGVTDISTAKEISDADTVTISSATLIKVTDADNDDDLALIAGGRSGQYLTIVFDDTITVIDDDVATATNAIDVFDDNNNNSESFALGDVLVLVFDGTCWHEVARSMNATE